MREFDLQRAFLGLGRRPKDFEDQPGASSTLVFQAFQDCAAGSATGASITHPIHLMPGDEPDDLLDLALAKIGRGPDLTDPARLARPRSSDRCGARDRRLPQAAPPNRVMTYDPFAIGITGGACADKGR